MTVPPEYIAERPAVQAAVLGLDADGQPHDLLSELLRSVHLRGERIVAYAPLPTFSIGFADIGALHIVEHGELDLVIDGDDHVERLRRGDVILLPRGDAHHIGNSSRRPGDDDPARWLCGTFTIGDSQASHLLASLPAVIILRGARDQALEWLEVSRRMLLFEMHAPSQGSAVMVARILDLLFIQILRAWAARTDVQPNWLAGALDPQIGPAFRAIHGDPARDWTVEELARGCNLSRSAFAERFAARVGTPPATYLGHVRLDAAATLLHDTSLTVALVAARVGYTSEAAFSRAFRQLYGTPPARWRRDARAK
jgi:AraC-like DNA-binding protein